MKLVRDNIPDLYLRGELEPRSTTRGMDFRLATTEELDLLLRLKLVEELGEVLSAPTTERRVSELYDLLDVVRAYMAYSRADEVDEAAHRAKLSRLGGFTEGWVLK
jgi:predicted house-cleaning noncanonical NTP pyrophosphatase (MazG superfamily)